MKVKRNKIMLQPEHSIHSSQYFSDSSDDSDCDSDEELQKLFAEGKLKPGLNIPVELADKKIPYINNVTGLKQKLQDIQQDFPWLERLDLATGHAPMAPEMALMLEEEKEKSELRRGRDRLDEFTRETMFHRQAQAAVLEGMERLKSLNISTKRPEDYFAEMAKSDRHMQKVREMLVKKTALTERIQLVRKIREQKKLSKQIQAESKLKKQNEKKSMMDEVKKFRKGVRKDLNFLDDKKRPLKNNKNQNRSQLKRKFKDSKFGFGGKKRGLKRNTRESCANDDDGHSRGPRSQKPKGPKKRPGKSRRKNMKRKNK